MLDGLLQYHCIKKLYNLFCTIPQIFSYQDILDMYSAEFLQRIYVSNM